MRKIRSAILNMRNRHLFVVDSVALLFTPSLALILRLDSLGWWPKYGQLLVVFTAFSLVVKLLVFYKFGLYHRFWRFASVSDLVRVVGASALSTLVLTALVFALQPGLGFLGVAIPRTLPIIEGLLSLLIVGGFRVGLRGLHQWHRQSSTRSAQRRILIVGAGELGTIVVREIRANAQLNMVPVAFVDDDLAKADTYIENVPVLGTVGELPKLVAQHQIQLVILATASAPFRRQQEIVKLCHISQVSTLSVPGVYELMAGYKTISPLPQVDVNRLLCREPVVADPTEVAPLLRGAKVLITGAGGSIGSELCRQIAQFEPAEVIVLGHGENSIFEIGLELRLTFPSLVVHSLIVDVRNQQQVDHAVEKHRPEVIFHAAAHKHVHFMEDNISEAFTNNVLGTHNVLLAAERYAVEHFVLISTDKAVNPTSIMGATKRLAELLVQTTARRTRRSFIAVRFGNVLGSRGSVVPVFQRQIAAGGPITLTHPDMRRYFMTIPEAVQLVLQAAVLGRGGEIFLLDMGKQVRISHLASELIRMSGLKPGKDIKIVHAGIRPGEKLSEELFVSGEDYRRSRHEKIFVVTRESGVDEQMLDAKIAEIITRGQWVQPQEIVDFIQRSIPEYRPKQSSDRSQVRPYTERMEAAHP